MPLAARLHVRTSSTNPLINKAPKAKKEINELPVLTTRSKDILQPGMTFAFEPKFVLAGIGAVGIENTFLVTDSGVEKMTLLDILMFSISFQNLNLLIKKLQSL